MIKNLINRLLYRYDSSDYITRNKARFILYLILAIIVLAPVMLVYLAYIHTYDPFYDYKLLLRIFIPTLIAFLLSLTMIIVLVRGHFSLAGNLLLIIWQTALWSVIFIADEEPLIRIDTLIMIATTLTMMPIIIVRAKMLFVIYPLVNIILLFTFMFSFKKSLNFPETVFMDYVSIYTITYASIGIISYVIYSINTKALEKAESEIAEREKSEEQKNRLQMQLLQSQKLESVGLLAGGVAHDFNNMLAAIQGYAELAVDSIDPHSSAKSEIDEIIKVSKKARDLTRQLLAFARVQPMDMKNINLNKLIGDFTEMLSRTLRGNITINNRLCENPGSIKGDPVQLEQVILNLALNAQDSMPEGGEIIIETSRITLDNDSVKGLADIAPGQYIKLSIKDTGAGINPEIIDHIFSPFYTTKEFGKGTGLGLSTVYGIVKQHNGMVQVNSEINKGSAFSIYLPVKDETPVPESLINADKDHLSGDETVLAVEDTPEVRKMLEKVLKKNGYNTLIADNAKNALAIAATYQGKIHLLITDVIMPDMDGMHLYSKIREMRPGIRIIYISGYTANVITDSTVPEDDINFIQKPFSVASFTKKVRDVLDQ